MFAFLFKLSELCACTYMSVCVCVYGAAHVFVCVFSVAKNKLPHS